jgi:N-acetylneuraminic acid mutarotase
MPTAREGLVTATVDGILYAIGGARLGKAIQTVEAYDPGTKTWSNHPNLPRRREDPSGAAVIGGKIYVTGGQDSIFTTKSLYVYNTSSKLWQNKDLPVPTKSGISAAINGKLYVSTPEGAVYGGTAHLHRYDPATNH